MANTLSKGMRPPAPPPKTPDKPGAPDNAEKAETPSSPEPAKASTPAVASPPPPTPSISPASTAPVPPPPIPANLVPVQTSSQPMSLHVAATATNVPAQPTKPLPSAAQSALHEDSTSMHQVATSISNLHSMSGGSLSKPTAAAPAVAQMLVDGERPKVWLATHKAPADPDPRLILVREPDSMRAACFRVMRHRLADRGNPRVIAVSSPGAGDGKTTCAANLALALSEFARAKVLLLEANMRSPQLAVLFGFLPPECFSVQLQRHRERPLEPWSIVEAFSPSLHVLAVKPGEANRPLLDAPAFAIALEMLLRVGYDYIVVDTPPVLGSADVNLVEDYVDAIVLATRAGSTRGRELRAAVEQISPRKLVGVALIDA